MLQLSLSSCILHQTKTGSPSARCLNLPSWAADPLQQHSRVVSVRLVPLPAHGPGLVQVLQPGHGLIYQCNQMDGSEMAANGQPLGVDDSDDDILSYVKMHFFYVKSIILRKWSNILCKYYVTVFMTEHSLLRRSIPLRQSGQPSHPACPPPDQTPDQPSHPTRPASSPGQPPHPARRPTWPATPPCRPAFPDCLVVLLRHDCIASIVTR